MFLQFAVPVGRTGQAVQRMVGDVEFHHAATNVGKLLILRRHFHALCHGCRAGGRKSFHSLDFHQTHTAGAKCLELIGGT